MSELTGLDLDESTAYQLQSYSIQLLDKLKTKQLVFKAAPCSSIFHFLQLQPAACCTFVLRCVSVINPVFPKLQAAYASDEQVQQIIKENALKRLRADELCLNILQSLKLFLAFKTGSKGTLNEMIDLFDPNAQTMAPTSSIVVPKAQHVPTVRFRGQSFLGLMSDLYQDQLENMQQLLEQTAQIVDLLHTESIKQFVFGLQMPVCDCELPQIKPIMTKSLDQFQRMIVGDCEVDCSELIRIMCMFRCWLVGRAGQAAQELPLLELVRKTQVLDPQDQLNISDLLSNGDLQNEKQNTRDVDEDASAAGFKESRSLESLRSSALQTQRQEENLEVISKHALAALLNLLQKKEDAIRQLVAENANLVSENRELKKQIQQERLK